MSVEQGWYHYPGDPEGTVRLWNGQDWVGFPTTPPPGYGGAPIEDYRPPTAAPTPVRPFKNQVRLAPLAVLACAGLGATALFALRALQKVRSELSANEGVERVFIDDDSLLRAPFSADVFRDLLIVAVAGGILFLAWVWRANANTGAVVRPRRNTSRQFGIKWFFLGWGWLLVEAIFRAVFTPVITRMFNAIERSTPGGSQGVGATVIGFAWWILWVASGAVFLVSACALALPDVGVDADSMRVWANVQTGALGAHVLSIVLAIVLVVNVTIEQDRRLGR